MGIPPLFGGDLRSSSLLTEPPNTPALLPHFLPRVFSDGMDLPSNKHKPSLTFRPASARSPSKKPSAGRGLLLLKRAGKERKHSLEWRCKTLKRPSLWGQQRPLCSPAIPSHQAPPPQFWKGIPSQLAGGALQAPFLQLAVCVPIVLGEK